MIEGDQTLSAKTLKPKILDPTPTSNSEASMREGVSGSINPKLQSPNSSLRSPRATNGLGNLLIRVTQGS